MVSLLLFKSASRHSECTWDLPSYSPYPHLSDQCTSVWERRRVLFVLWSRLEPFLPWSIIAGLFHPLSTPLHQCKMLPASLAPAPPSFLWPQVFCSSALWKFRSLLEYHEQVQTQLNSSPILLHYSSLLLSTWKLYLRAFLIQVYAAAAIASAACHNPGLPSLRETYLLNWTFSAYLLYLSSTLSH